MGLQTALDTAVKARTSHRQMVGLDFGRGVTNNEAEYRTLISGLKDLVGRIQRAGKSPSGYSLLVHTDSQLVVGQLTQGWQGVKSAMELLSEMRR